MVKQNRCLAIGICLLLMAKMSQGTSWDCAYQAEILPENYDGGIVFNCTSYIPTGIIRGVKGCQYYASTSENSNCSFNTKIGVFNAAAASTIEFKIKNLSSLNTYTNAIMIRAEGRGYVQFSLSPSHRTYAGDNPNIYFEAYVDAYGWSTFRCLTNVSNGNLSGADLYYLKADGNWSTSIHCGFIISSSQSYDSILFGDIGLAFSGRSYLDYFYWAQFAATLDPIAMPPTLVGVDAIVSRNDETSVMFPFMKRFGTPGNNNAVIWLSYNAGNHTTNEWTEYLISYDNGQTWNTPNNTIRPLNTVQKPDGTIMSASCWDTTESMFHNLGIFEWSSPTSTPTSRIVWWVSLPWNGTLLAHRSLVLSDMNDSSKMILTFYGRVAGEAKYHSSLLKSNDGGLTWSYLATVARSENAEGEGYCEPVLVRLADNSLLCLMRSGTGYACKQSHSVDGGLTWSTPIAIPDSTSSIWPDVTLMSNGALIAIVGTRPGEDVFVDHTGSGNNWQKVYGLNFRGDGYYNSCTAIAEVEPNLVMMVIPQSDFLFMDGFIGPDYSGTNKLQKGMIQISPKEGIMCCGNADLSPDCYIDFKDISILATNWLSTGWNTADINNDEHVDINDFAAMASQWLLVLDPVK